MRSSTKRYADDDHLTVGSALALKTPTGQTFTCTSWASSTRRRAEGRSARSRLDSDVRPLVREPRQRPHADQHARRSVGGEHAADRTEPHRVPGGHVETREEFKATRTGEFKTTLKILYALLGLSVIVSLFGIVNTLVLSVFERTRELGMLRAIGMTRRQVRRMIRHESIVTALIGATFGIAVGMFLAVMTTTRCRSTASCSRCRTSRS